ncbi:MAG: hypothetical protein ACRBN8_26295 [Nannocystales bacterium]
MKTPPAPSEDLLFSPPTEEPATHQSAQASRPGHHAPSSDSGMSDERNADSVLFKLDTLSAMQAHKTLGGAPKQMARLAAQAPASDAGSGLIDLKTLAGTPPQEETGAAHESQTASASGSDVTSSAALSQSALLSSSSMLAASPAPDATPSLGPTAAPSRTPLIVLSVLAVLALLAAVTALLLRG